MTIDWSKENLEKLAKESWCQSDMYQKLSGRWDTSTKLMNLIHKYDIDISHWRKQQPTVNVDDEDPIPTNPRQEKMLELRKQGKTFSEIAEELHCSKSSVSYFFRKTTREKVKEGKDKYTDWELRIIRGISRFQTKESHTFDKTVNKNWNMKLRGSVNKFLKVGGHMSKFGYKDVLEKYNNQTIIECYLTGDKIDLTKDDFAFDHIVPISRGGSCELDNLGITTPIANASKSYMTKDEYIELCKKVLIHQGYTVIDNHGNT